MVFAIFFCEMANSPVQIYRPRDPLQSPLHRLIAEHLDELREVYDTDYAPTYGPWRPFWDKALEAFLSCGDLHRGFARVYCDACKHSFFTAFSCKSRGICPSCEGRRRALWAEHVTCQVLPSEMAYRMSVFTIPKCIRSTLLRERRLLGDLSREAYACTRQFIADQFPGTQGAPFFISVVQLFGNSMNVHPHLHCLVSLGIKATDGKLHHLRSDLDFSPLVEAFRRATLGMLLAKHRITEKTQQTLLSWKNSGFSVNTDVLVPPGDMQGLERVASYVLRPPISLQRLEYRSGAPTVIYHSKYNAAVRGNFTALKAEEFIVRLLCLIPEPRECLIRYYGAASSTARRNQKTLDRQKQGDDPPLVDDSSPEAKEEKKPKASTWARLIAKAFGENPLCCPRCGGKMRVIAFIHDPAVCERILRHLDRWDPPSRAPPANNDYSVEYDEDLPVEIW